MGNTRFHIQGSNRGLNAAIAESVGTHLKKRSTSHFTSWRYSRVAANISVHNGRCLVDGTGGHEASATTASTTMASAVAQFGGPCSAFSGSSGGIGFTCSICWATLYRCPIARVSQTHHLTQVPNQSSYGAWPTDGSEEGLVMGEWMNVNVYNWWIIPVKR